MQKQNRQKTKLAAKNDQNGKVCLRKESTWRIGEGYACPRLTCPADDAMCQACPEADAWLSVLGSVLLSVYGVLYSFIPLAAHSSDARHIRCNSQVIRDSERRAMMRWLPKEPHCHLYYRPPLTAFDVTVTSTFN